MVLDKDPDEYTSALGECFKALFPVSYGISIVIVQRKEVKREWSCKYLDEEAVGIDLYHAVFVCGHVHIVPTCPVCT